MCATALAETESGAGVAGVISTVGSTVGSNVTGVEVTNGGVTATACVIRGIRKSSGADGALRNAEIGGRSVVVLDGDRQISEG
jgi:hypothetical protein